MTDRESRERLVEIIRQAKTEVVCYGEPATKWQRNIVDRAEANDLADHLIANGVIVQKQGEWVSAPIKEKGYDSKTIPTCTNCGYQSFITYTYCPKCGAKLKELGK